MATIIKISEQEQNILLTHLYLSKCVQIYFWSTELEESRSLLRKIATGVRKKEKSFQHASQKEAHRHRFRGEKKEDCLKKDKS